MTSTNQPIKRHRDPLSPKPILDRATLSKELQFHTAGAALKNADRQIDLFYQLLHRAGYNTPLDAFVSSLISRDDCGLLPSHSHDSDANDSIAVKLPAKNAVSSQPGRLPQLSKAFLDFLSDRCIKVNDDEEKFVMFTSKVKMYQTSADGTTTKIAVELQDGHVVESVLMRHEGRATLCVSSQVGCAMGCTFCATGTMGIRGNLCSGEILEQMVHASRILASDDVDDGRNSKRKDKSRKLDLIRNIVFMGMGEPLNNYANVLTTCRALIDRRLWNLSHNRVTVSTVGVTSRMRDLTRDLPEVNLALSLHAPNQKMREAIVPAAKGTPIESLIEALDEHMMAFARRKLLENPQESSSGSRTDQPGGGGQYDIDERVTASKKKRAMIEYVMLEGDTSTIEAAHQLGNLCEGRQLVVNLIPYNKTNVKDKLSCPSEEHMQEFRRIVSSYGSFCSIRRTMGADIAGACGQLVVEQEKQEMKVIGDIEDGPMMCLSSAKKSKAVGTSRKRGNSDGKEGSSKGEDKVIRHLIVATGIATSFFVVSAALFVIQRRRR